MAINTKQPMGEDSINNNPFTGLDKSDSKKMAIWSMIIALVGIFIFHTGILNGVIVLVALFLNMTAWIAYPSTHRLYSLIGLIFTIIAFW